MWKNKIMNGMRALLNGNGGPRGMSSVYQQMILAYLRDGAVELNAEINREEYDSREWIGWNHAPWKSTLLTMSDGKDLVSAALIIRMTARKYRVHPIIIGEHGGLFAASPELVEIDMDSPYGPVVLSARGVESLEERDQKTLNAVSFFLAVARCDNVEKRQVSGAKNERRGGAAVLDREKFPRFEHYVLEIKQDDNTSIKDDDPTEPGQPKRLHLCRGHWAVYTEDKPLFGRYVGRFWVPDHKRGNAELGQIFKDYKVRS